MTKVYLEIDDVKKLENAAANLRDRLLIRLLFRLGCRISEALALTPQQLDLEQGTVTILHLKRRSRVFCPQCGVRLSKSYAFCPGCSQKVGEAVKKELEQRRVRTLPLDRDTMDMLRDYIQRGGPVSRKGTTLIFGINRHRAWQVLRECGRRAGLGQLMNPESGRTRGISPHRLRDAFAVMAVKIDDSGDGLRLLQEHLGHQSFDTTAKYRKVAGEEHRQWYNNMWRKVDTDSG